MDIFFEFMKLYQEGKFDEALRLMIPNPESTYDQLTSSSRSLPQLANYADSVVFGDYYDYCIAMSLIAQILGYDPIGIYKDYNFRQTIIEESVIKRLHPEPIDLIPIEKAPPPFKSL